MQTHILSLTLILTSLFSGCQSTILADQFDQRLSFTRRAIRRAVVFTEPAQLVGKQPNQVSGNNLLNPGDGAAFAAFSVQQIDSAGDSVEATLKATSATSGAASFAFAPPAIAQTNNVAGDLKHLNVLFYQYNGTTTVAFNEDGVFKHSIRVAGDPQSVQLRVEFTSNAANCYVNQELVYTSKRTLQLPYKLALVAQTQAQIDNILFTLN